MALATYPAGNRVSGRGRGRPQPAQYAPGVVQAPLTPALAGRGDASMYGQYPRSYNNKPTYRSTIDAPPVPYPVTPPGDSFRSPQDDPRDYSLEAQPLPGPPGQDFAPLQQLRQRLQNAPPVQPLQRIDQAFQNADINPLQRLRQYLWSRRGTRFR